MKNHSHPFKNVGYQLDVYFNKKFIGSIPLEKPDRDIMGHYGRADTILPNNVQIKKHFLRAGTIVQTECIPLCGRIISNDQLDKEQIIAQSFAGLISDKLLE